MFKNFKPLIISLALCLTILFFAQAASATLQLGNSTEFINSTANQAGLQQSDLVSFIATIIQAVLGLVGIIFLVLIIYSGIRWMTSAGNEKQVEGAKKIISGAIIGLLIIVAAYSITYFIAAALEVKP
ncbi:MAG: hypothetical protein PHC97_00645 [Patescibacteria group bacterium]|nr:hypothetical protein [Patescibacteria group bacterium]